MKTLTQLASIATMLALKTAQIIQPKEANTKKNMDFLQSQKFKAGYRILKQIILNISQAIDFVSIIKKSMRPP